MASVDTSIFSMEIGGFPPDAFRVLEFTGTEALCETFCFRVKAVAFDVNLKYDDTIGNAVQLIVKGQGYEITHHGIITHFNQLAEPDVDGGMNFYYELTIEPKLKHLSFHLRSRIFQNKTVQEIVEELLAEYVEKDTSFKFEAKVEDPLKAYPKREFTVQYNETDWDFIKRLLEDEGIYWYWTHEGDRDMLVMASGIASVKPLVHNADLPFMSEGGLTSVDGREYVDTMERSVRYVTGRATIKDYNYRTPDVNVQGMHDMVGTGAYVHFGDHVKTTDEATRKAKIRAEMFAMGRETFKGTGVFRSARPGYRFKLSEAKLEGLDGEYLITRVTHVGGFDPTTGETADANDGPVAHYRCAFEAIPAKTVFRPPLLTSKPRVNGILTALIDGQKDKYAYIDDEGRYKVKLFFDPSEEKDGKASKAIRLAQPYAGPGYGMHFPLHTGTEIAIGFIDGDPDRPIGLGAVPNPGKGSPVKSGNKSSNVMKSHTGNSVTLEDKEGKTGVFISSTGGHSATLNDDGGSKGITLSTSGSNMMALDDTNKKMVISTAGGHSITIDDNAKTISVSSSGGNTVVVDDNGNKITITAASTSIAMDGGGGKIAIDASSDITITAGGNLTLDVTGDFTLNAKNVNLNASAEMKADAKGTTISGGPKIAMDAASIKISGTADVGLDAPKIDVAATAAAKVAGAVVELAAQGICTIAGATVKIN